MEEMAGLLQVNPAAVAAAAQGVPTMVTTHQVYHQELAEIRAGVMALAADLLAVVVRKVVSHFQPILEAAVAAAVAAVWLHKPT
jgi:hypothetical protein